MRRHLRHEIKRLLDIAQELLLRLLEGETRAVVIVSVMVPVLLVLAWLCYRNIRRIAKAERRAAEIPDHWPPSAEDVARVINPAPLEMPAMEPARKTHKIGQLDK